MTDELKPCPFCGGPAQVVGEIFAFVACRKCKAHTRFYPENIKAAIVAWNQRVENQKEEGSVSELA